MSSTLKTLLLWTVIFVVVILLWNAFQAGKAARTEVPFSEFMERVHQGQVKEVTIKGPQITGAFRRGNGHAEGGRAPPDLAV